MKKYINQKLIISIQILILPVVFFVTENVQAQQYLTSMCGPYCLLRMCQVLKKDANLEEICSITRHDRQNGVSMLDLYNGAMKKNLKVKAVLLSIDELSYFTGYNIVFVNNSHFMLVLKITDEHVIVQDPPYHPYMLSKDEFLNMWEGHTLIFNNFDKKISRKTKKKDYSGPSITFDKSEYDFGVLDGKNVYNYDLVFKNTGQDTLVVERARATCSCIKTTLENKAVGPGDYGKIKIRLNTFGSEDGTHKYNILLKTNDMQKENMNIAIRYESIEKKEEQR